MAEIPEYMTQADIYDLIDEISDLNKRLDKLADEIMSDRADASLLAAQKRSHSRLMVKRENMLTMLNQAMAYLRE